MLGNEVIVKQTIGDTFDFSIYSFATANVVVDVSGYFMAPVATSLDCTRLSNSVNVPANNGSLVAELHCPVGYNATGGGCNNNANNQLRSFRVSASPDETDSWFECNWVNPAVTPMPADVSVRCCRTRGR